MITIPGIIPGDVSLGTPAKTVPSFISKGASKRPYFASLLASTCQEHSRTPNSCRLLASIAIHSFIQSINQSINPSINQSSSILVLFFHVYIVKSSHMTACPTGTCPTSIGTSVTGRFGFCLRGIYSKPKKEAMRNANIVSMYGIFTYI